MQYSKLHLHLCQPAIIIRFASWRVLNFLRFPHENNLKNFDVCCFFFRQSLRSTSHEKNSIPVKLLGSLNSYFVLFRKHSKFKRSYFFSQLDSSEHLWSKEWESQKSITSSILLIGYYSICSQSTPDDWLTGKSGRREMRSPLF